MPKPLPFLHPRKPAVSSHYGPKGLAALQSQVTRQILGEKPSMRATLKETRTFSDAQRNAPPKLLNALTGKDPFETIGRFARATRRQNKEFGATIHPISGRMMGMTRGKATEVAHPVPVSRTRAVTRMAELADTAKNPAVRARATANLNGKNPNLAGPQPISVHSHPQYKGETRNYPSSQDLGVMEAQRQRQMTGQHAVASLVPNPVRGGKNTSVVFSSQDRPRGRTQQARSGATRRRGNALQLMTAADQATIPPAVVRRARQPGMGQVVRIQRAATGTNLPRTGEAWDGLAQATTTGPATVSGFRTRRTVVKRDVPLVSAFLDRRALKVASQMGKPGTALANGVTIGQPTITRGMVTPHGHRNIPGFRSGHVNLVRGKKNVGRVTGTQLPTGHVFMSEMALKPSERGKGVGGAALRAVQGNAPHVDTPSINFLASGAKADAGYGTEQMTGQKAWRQPGVRFMRAPGAGITGQRAYDAPREAATRGDAKRIKRVIRRSRYGRVTPEQAFKDAPELEGASWYGQIKGGQPFLGKTRKVGAVGAAGYGGFKVGEKGKS